jgi:hypothetical protein
MTMLNSALQALVDNLHGKITTNQALSEQEQTLIDGAISILSASTNWEQALLAVAESHLTEVGQTLNTTLTTATDVLTTAKVDITAAGDAILSQSANMALIPGLSDALQTTLNGYSATHASELAELTQRMAGSPKQLYGIQSIETQGSTPSFQRGQAAFVVYDSDGQTYVARPGYFPANDTEEVRRLEVLKLKADGSGKEVLATFFVNAGNFYATPAAYIYQYGTIAFVPLANKADSSSIACVALYSTQTSASALPADYGGVYCLHSGTNTITKPKQNIDATDQWGFATATSHAWDDVGVLYDNNKHCAVMVDDSTGTLIEKYRDGNIDTGVAIADSAALQSHVNAGDFTAVKFISNIMTFPSGTKRSDGIETGTNLSVKCDLYGYFGKLGSTVKMGGTKYNAHYRFTPEKKLEPLNYHFSNSTSANKEMDANGTDSGVSEVDVAMVDAQGNTLGLYYFKTKADYRGDNAAFLATAILCINPYSHVGIISEYNGNHSGAPVFGIGRTCRAF